MSGMKPVPDLRLEILFQNENPSVRGWAAAYALDLNIKIDKAAEVLRSISEDPKFGIFGFNAKITLQEWEKKNHISPLNGRGTG
jgi:hypothetical protein